MVHVEWIVLTSVHPVDGPARRSSEMLLKVGFKCHLKSLPKYRLYVSHPWRFLEELLELRVENPNQMFSLAVRPGSQRERYLAFMRNRESAAIVVDTALSRNVGTMWEHQPKK